MGRALLAIALLAILICGPALAPSLAPSTDAFGTELVERLPKDVVGVFSIDNAAKLRESELGATITQWMGEQDALSRSRKAWKLFADRLGVSEADAFDEFLGGHAVLAFGRSDAPGWIVLAAVDPEMDVRMRRRTRAVPKSIVHGRAVFRLEEESFLLATLPAMADGRSVLALAPAEAEWLLEKTLAISAGKGEAFSSEVLRLAPTDAAVRGYWKPNGASGFFGDVERWLWGQHEPMQALAVWATVRDGTIDIGLSTVAIEAEPLPEPAEAAEGVLLDLTGPGEAIVAGVLDRAGLTGLVPEGLTVTREIGELVVKRGRGGMELGARLPVASADSLAETPLDQPAVDKARVRIRELSETRASRAVFGRAAQMAWTVLDRRAEPAELVVAVTAGPDAAPRGKPGEKPNPNAFAIVAEATARPTPTSIGLHGSAYPYELWSLLLSTAETADPWTIEPESGGFASISALFDTARWAVEKALGRVRGRIVLDLRKAERR